MALIVNHDGLVIGKHLGKEAQAKEDKKKNQRIVTAPVLFKGPPPPPGQCILCVSSLLSSRAGLSWMALVFIPVVVPASGMLFSVHAPTLSLDPFKTDARVNQHIADI